ncbi:MAG TPA: hypothetical protein VJ305_04875 [Streptosporangiaceae bacterium]|nr:hypothetical protein [Streptosporangiaceae bacterium]
MRPGQRGGYPAIVIRRRLEPGTRDDDDVRRGHRSAAGTATPLIDLAVLALRIHNRQIGS